MGWIVPPPKKPVKTRKDFEAERIEKIKWLIEQNLLISERIAKAMTKVSREDFIPEDYRDYAYLEVPLPIPGEEATISCPHSYPLFYEALELRENDRFLEVGTGSGYGAALAREIVGGKGRVVTVEIDKRTYEFAKDNLERHQYSDVLVILGDGSLGYPLEAPYDKICITAACPRIPEPLISQMNFGGKLVAPVGYPNCEQDLTLLKKEPSGQLRERIVDKVLYVPLKGRFGFQPLT